MRGRVEKDRTIKRKSSAQRPFHQANKDTYVSIVQANQRVLIVMTCQRPPTHRNGRGRLVIPTTHPTPLRIKQDLNRIRPTRYLNHQHRHALIGLIVIQRLLSRGGSCRYRRITRVANGFGGGEYDPRRGVEDGGGHFVARGLHGECGGCSREIDGGIGVHAPLRGGGGSNVVL